MSLLMQIYLTILIGLIISESISGAVYRVTTSDGWHRHEVVEAVSGIWLFISSILCSGWVVYIVLALIWHWY